MKCWEGRAEQRVLKKQRARERELLAAPGGSRFPEVRGAAVRPESA